ncbi:hypothetical protein [Nitrospina gracilis]|uniref:hypothetical protein n=1 Tax=Nitrospina gracilis TaxID=35801 RepID=UPI001F3E2E01|nr:hypothetical protein [Nitrospina gracilis]MCF8720340.1 bifunctional DNA-binding transcriptional regulator/antitoxin component of YhaV-PrlF toxin-antitoxin module [Nitrospina gracilis Nb-211]
MQRSRRNPAARLWRGALLFWTLWFAILPPATAWTQDEPRPYVLYQNFEKHGIVVWPRDPMPPELKDFIASLGFKEIAQGLAVMRFGAVNQNGTFMMPEPVQEKFGIKRFIILQILSDRIGIMVGIWEQEFGLTLPQKVFNLDEVKENIPKTLDIFREQEGTKPISWRQP